MQAPVRRSVTVPSQSKGVAHPSPKAPQHKQPPRSPLSLPDRRESSEARRAAAKVKSSSDGPHRRLRMNLQPAEPGATFESAPGRQRPGGSERTRVPGRVREENLPGWRAERLRRWWRVWGLRPPLLSLPPREPSTPRRQFSRLAPRRTHSLSAPRALSVPITFCTSQPLGILTSDPRPPRIQSPATERPGPQRTLHRSSR